jgi:gluconate 2-dehydrogenase gamma chain
MSRPTRREVIIAAASASLGAAGALWVRPRPTSPKSSADGGAPQRPSVPSDLRTLRAPEYIALAAVCARIFPRDETPDAVELGVPEYVDQALSGDPLPAWADGFLTSLAHLDLACFEKFGVAFAAAKPMDQDATLASWASEAEGDNPRFIRSAVVATLEGVLGDPSYGGNRDGQGWKAFGFRPDPFSPSLRRRP